MAAPKGQLLVIWPDATTARIVNSSREIAESTDHMTLSLMMRAADDYGFFVDDNGMVNGSQFNVVASMLASRPIWGTVVLIGGSDEEGNTLPPEAQLMKIGETFGRSWRYVIAEAENAGQDLTHIANPNTVPPPRIIEMTDDVMEALFNGQTRRG